MHGLWDNWTWQCCFGCKGWVWELEVREIGSGWVRCCAGGMMGLALMGLVTGTDGIGTDGNGTDGTDGTSAFTGSDRQQGGGWDIPSCNTRPKR